MITKEQRNSIGIWWDNKGKPELPKVNANIHSKITNNTILKAS